MASVTLSPLFNGWQGLGSSLVLLNGGLLNTYLAGSTTPAATYTTIAGSVQNTNPIVLNSDGRPPQEIWLDTTKAYKFVLTDSLANVLGTYDNIYPVPTLTAVQSGAYSLLGAVAGTNTITATASPTLSAYASGQLFILVPANSNTGSTTLNIDGLGAKNVFSGGAACLGTELVAGVPAAVFYDGTQFNILGGPFSTTFTGAWTGFTAGTTGTIYGRKIGNTVTLKIPTKQGTSNAVSKTITGMPNSLKPATGIDFITTASDNGGAFVASLGMLSASGVITLYATLSAGAWTASGIATVGPNGAGNITVSYTLD